MRFVYQAKDKQGAVVSGDIEASSLSDARQRLRSQGFYLSSLAPHSAARGINWRKSLAPRGGVSRTDILMLLSQLTIMCQSGVDLAEALRTLATQSRKPALRSVLEKVSNDVNNGASFSNALAKHPAVFDSAFVAGVASGEKAGAITPVLERLTFLLRGDMRLRSTIVSMLSYPIVLCSVTLLVVIALLFFVLPQFSKVFADMEKPVPPLTQLLLSFGDLLRTHWVLVIGTVVGSGVAAFTLRNAAFVRRYWDYATLHFAIIKHATRALATGRAFRLLGTMLASGVPLVEGIRLCRAATKNSLFRQLFERAENDVLRGEGLGRTLLASTILPSSTAQMVATAERTGKLDEVLKTVGEYFEDEGERYLRNCIKLLEPTLIVALGVVVAGVVLSIILPLLDVSTASH